MRIGVHCSVRNGFEGALEEAHSLGCQTLQIFTQSPRGWKTRDYPDKEFDSFRRRRIELGLSPIVVHSPYLPNLCTSDPDLYQKSVDWLLGDLLRCRNLGAEYLVIHPGAYSLGSSLKEGMDNLIRALNYGLSRVEGEVVILVENMAGGGRRLGAHFQELAGILAGVENKQRVGVCFDTCHATGAGYSLKTAADVERTLQMFESLVGLRQIRVFHVNDAKDDLGSHRDRHEHLGEGFVGLDGFKALFRNPQFSSCALILETPKTPAPEADLKNLKILRSVLPV